MDVYLTLREQEREKNLFAPHQAVYKLPEVRVDLRTLVIEVSEEDYIVQEPLSC